MHICVNLVNHIKPEAHFQQCTNYGVNQVNHIQVNHIQVNPDLLTIITLLVNQV